MHILIIDDSIEQCEIVAMHLSRQGHEYRICTDALAYTEHLHQDLTGCVIVDLSLNNPQKNGIDIIREVNALYPLIPIIVHTGNYLQYQKDLEGLTYLSIIEKPHDCVELCRAVTEACKLRSFVVTAYLSQPSIPKAQEIISISLLKQAMARYRYPEKKITKEALCKICEISKPTFYKYEKKILKELDEAERKLNSL